MNTNKDVVIGNYKITKVIVSEGWGENWGIRGNDNSKVIGFSITDTRTNARDEDKCYLNRIALRRLPVVVIKDGKIAKDTENYVFSVSRVSGYVPHESEYTIGIWTGSEEDLVSFYTHEMQVKRDAEVQKQNDFALFCLNNPLPPPRK